MITGVSTIDENPILGEPGKTITNKIVQVGMDINARPRSLEDGCHKQFGVNCSEKVC